MLKFILPFVLFITSTISISAQRYLPGDAGSKVHFTIKNFGIKTGGELTGLKGEIFFFYLRPCCMPFQCKCGCLYG